MTGAVANAIRTLVCVYINALDRIRCYEHRSLDRMRFVKEIQDFVMLHIINMRMKHVGELI